MLAVVEELWPLQKHVALELTNSYFILQVIPHYTFPSFISNINIVKMHYNLNIHQIYYNAIHKLSNLLISTCLE